MEASLVFATVEAVIHSCLYKPWDESLLGAVHGAVALQMFSCLRSLWSLFLISCGIQICLLALPKSRIWKMHHLYAWLGARKASYGVDNNCFQWSQLTHYASEILGRGWPTSSQLRFLSVLFMCGSTLLKAQLAARTEESCLETEPVVSIRCLCLRSLRSVIFLRNFTEPQRVLVQELGQDAVFEKDFTSSFFGSVFLFSIRDFCVWVCWSCNKPVCPTLKPPGEATTCWYSASAVRHFG